MRAGWRAGSRAIILVLAATSVLAGCSPAAGSPSDTPTDATATRPPVVAGGAGGGNGNGGGSAPPSEPPSTPPSPPPSEPPSASPSGLAGPPYVVKQTQHQGGETVSGVVCDTRRPFSVHFVTPTVTFDEAFQPESATQGTTSFAYSFPDLGESHVGTGSYTISPPGPNGVLHVKTTDSDHVVFNGFDGRIPRSYAFDLGPAAVPGCPT